MRVYARIYSIIVYYIYYWKYPSASHVNHKFMSLKIAIEELILYVIARKANLLPRALRLLNRLTGDEIPANYSF